VVSGGIAAADVARKRRRPDAAWSATESRIRLGYSRLHYVIAQRNVKIHGAIRIASVREAGASHGAWGDRPGDDARQRRRCKECRRNAA